MSKLEDIEKNIREVNKRLFEKFGTESYQERCWLHSLIIDLQSLTSSHREEIEALERKALECWVENDLTPFGVAQLWYLKGFKDAETTERQPVPIEQTMKDAEAHFGLVWECHKTPERFKK